MDAKVKIKPKVEVIKEPIPHLLVPGEMGAVLELTVKDKNGKVTEHRVMRSRSYVRQFLELLWVEMNQTPATIPLSMRDVNNVLKDIYARYVNFRVDGAVGITTLGIIVGTGTTAPTINDYTIETIIAHGGVGGQLNYSDTTIAAAASDATTSQLTITRDFANASGGDITVNEIALYSQGTDGANQVFMFIRDVIAGGILVPNGQTLTVNYREQAVV